MNKANKKPKNKARNKARSLGKQVIDAYQAKKASEPTDVASSYATNFKPRAKKQAKHKKHRAAWLKKAYQDGYVDYYIPENKAHENAYAGIFKALGRNTNVRFRRTHKKETADILNLIGSGQTFKRAATIQNAPNKSYIGRELTTHNYKVKGIGDKVKHQKNNPLRFHTGSSQTFSNLAKRREHAKKGVKYAPDWWQVNTVGRVSKAKSGKNLPANRQWNKMGTAWHEVGHSLGLKGDASLPGNDPSVMSRSVRRNKKFNKKDYQAISDFWKPYTSGKVYGAAWHKAEKERLADERALKASKHTKIRDNWLKAAYQDGYVDYYIPHKKGDQKYNQRHNKAYNPVFNALKKNTNIRFRRTFDKNTADILNYLDGGGQQMKRQWTMSAKNTPYAKYHGQPFTYNYRLPTVGSKHEKNPSHGDSRAKYSRGVSRGYSNELYKDRLKKTYGIGIKRDLWQANIAGHSNYVEPHRQWNKAGTTWHEVGHSLGLAGDRTLHERDRSVMSYNRFRNKTFDKRDYNAINAFWKPYTSGNAYGKAWKQAEAKRVAAIKRSQQKKASNDLIM